MRGKTYEYKEERSIQQTELLTVYDENQVTSIRLQSQQCPRQSYSSILNIRETTPIYNFKIVKFKNARRIFLEIETYLNNTSFEKCAKNKLRIWRPLEIIE